MIRNDTEGSECWELPDKVLSFWWIAVNKNLLCEAMGKEV